jgi:glycosyltransferase involved in cell wall biosynthesis
MRVLLLAEECNPEWPSVPAFAYQAARAISDHADVVLVTQIRNARNIERASLGRAKVVYINTEMVARPFWKLSMALRRGTETGWLLADVLGYPGHIAFEWLAAKYFRGALQRREFDVVHRLSPWSGVQPSFMATASPIPVLLGPINDNLPWPNESTDVLKREMTGADHLGLLGLPLVRRLPYQRSKYIHAKGVLACYEHTIDNLPDDVKAKTVNFPEVGIDPKVFILSPRPRHAPMTVLFVGRLVPYKLPDVIVRAFATSSVLRQHRLLIVGDGPERPRLKRLIAQNGLAGSVELTGWKSHAEVGRLMRQGDIFAFPSIHEMGGGVVIEAMACGLACVVVDFGGPATLIGPEWGVKVPVGNVSHLITSFRHELEQLVMQPERIAQLGLAAHRHAMTHYTWDVKARKTLEVYRWMTGRQAHKPDFWDPAFAEAISDHARLKP